MKIEKIITLANRPVELRFRVMVRSLRETGCDLPVEVIPYDDCLFELPEGCHWLKNDGLYDFLAIHRARNVLRKYVCLLHRGYQFVDSDVVFLRDPREALSSEEGFITSCGNWRDPAHTLTPELEQLMAGRTTMWNQLLFNSGQFACDRDLYSLEELMQALLDPASLTTGLKNPFHEQPGMNWLVFKSGVPIHNVTLPPRLMESTWSGDYPGVYEHYWMDRKRAPYLIHWAGQNFRTDRPIDQLYLRHMETDERKLWIQQSLIHCGKGGMRRRLQVVRRAAIRSIREAWKSTGPRADFR